MAENSEAMEERNRILLSFSEIFRSMERIDDSFIAIKRNGARYTGIVAGGLVILLWGMIGIPVILNHLFPIPVASTYTPPESYYTLSRAAFISVPILSLIAGFVTYYCTKKSYIQPFMSHKTQVQELENAINENKAKEMKIIEKTLQLIDQMSSWIPKLKRYKGDEAQPYGITAFLIVAFVSFLSGTWAVGLPISLLIGTMVWLYFRYEKRKEATLQVQEFKAWKQKFDEEKNAFLETI
jgi:hypothetical protein